MVAMVVAMTLVIAAVNVKMMVVGQSDGRIDAWVHACRGSCIG